MEHSTTIIPAVMSWPNGWAPTINGRMVLDPSRVPMTFDRQTDALDWWGDLGFAPDEINIVDRTTA